MLGNNFFVPGRAYRVITPRVDTRHTAHYFEVGAKIICKDIIRADEDFSHSSRDFRKARDEFRSDYLRGVFVGSDGLEQTLATGDVKAWRD